MNNFKQEMLITEAKKLKQKAIDEYGAIDFHFQIPKFDNPLLIIVSILKEQLSFNNAIQQFHMEKAEEAETPLEEIIETAHAQMWELWDRWNTVIGMILTSEDPKIIRAFDEMMKEFAEKQILKTKKGN